MTAKYRWGETNPITAPFKSGVAVAIADLVFIDDSDSSKVKPASSFTWGTAVATPTAPTVADGGVNVGSPLTNAATGVKISYQFPWGEGPLSSAGSATPTANATLKVSGAPLVPATDALWTNIYVETAAGSGTYKLWGTTLGSTKFVDSYGAGATPAASPITVSATVPTQYGFVQKFAGCSGQRYDGSNADAYGIKDGNLRIDTAGIFEFDCASATFAVGDLVGPAKASGNTLEPQKVVAVGSPALAIGRVAVPGASVTSVLVQILPSRFALANKTTL